MKILVLNGSPKGETSVTMQYVRYLQKVLPEYEFHMEHIAHGIRQIENNDGRFEEILSQVREADGVLWAFPLYVCLAHANYMRFVELITERGAQSAFAGKYAAALTTSIHFFDNTAHAWMRAVCDDLGMRYCGFFSPGMSDLTTAAGQRQLAEFGRGFLHSIETGLPTQRLYAPVRGQSPVYTPGPAGAKSAAGGKRVLLITDENPGDENLRRMTQRFVEACADPVEVVRLADARIKGGCLGCLKCGYNNQCVYGGSDDIQSLYNDKIRSADIIVLAGALQGRFLSARFKTFVDRRFLNTHQPQMVGKQLAYLISGPLGQNHNVVEVLQAIAELDRANLAGIVTDECDDSAAMDAVLDSLSLRLAELAEAGYVPPKTFLGVGGMKVFRDEIYGPLRSVFRADHKFFKKHGYYDFPQKNIGTRLSNVLMGVLNCIPPFRKKVQAEMTSFMLMPYQRIVG